MTGAYTTAIVHSVCGVELTDRLARPGLVAFAAGRIRPVPAAIRHPAWFFALRVVGGLAGLISVYIAGKFLFRFVAVLVFGGPVPSASEQIVGLMFTLVLEAAFFVFLAGPEPDDSDRYYDQQVYTLLNWNTTMLTAEIAADAYRTARDTARPPGQRSLVQAQQMYAQIITDVVAWDDSLTSADTLRVALRAIPRDDPAWEDASRLLNEWSGHADLCASASRKHAFRLADFAAQTATAAARTEDARATCAAFPSPPPPARR